MLEKQAKIVQGSLQEPLGPQEGPSQADLYPARTILDPFWDPKREPQNTPKSLPGPPRDAPEGFKVQKARLQMPLLVKLGIEHDFEHVWIGI